MTIIGILLAAGQSSRMGGNKLLAHLDGRPLICHAADAMEQSRLDKCITVLGHDADKVKTALSGFTTRFVTNPDYEQGQSTSVKCGIQAITDTHTNAAMILLGDMPLITPGIIDRIIDHHLADDNPQSRITLPRIGTHNANPVIWGRDFFPVLTKITGDKGGRGLFAENPDAMNFLDMEDDTGNAFLDADTDAALEKIRRLV